MLAAGSPGACFAPTLTLDGEPLVRRAVRAALDAGLAPVLVTVRPDASPELLEAVSGFDARVEIVPAPDAHLGQAESLKAGIRRLVSRFDCPPPGVVVLLGDQPLVGAELVRELTAFYLQKPECAAAPACDGVRGNPVITRRGIRRHASPERRQGRSGHSRIRLAPHAYQ
ncbi:MAG: NTP transferase domain-containing protein [Bilophila wadsworthia]